MLNADELGALTPEQQKNYFDFYRHVKVGFKSHSESEFGIKKTYGGLMELQEQVVYWWINCSTVDFTEEQLESLTQQAHKHISTQLHFGAWRGEYSLEAGDSDHFHFGAWHVYGIDHMFGGGYLSPDEDDWKEVQAQVSSIEEYLKGVENPATEE